MTNHLQTSFEVSENKNPTTILTINIYIVSDFEKYILSAAHIPHVKNYRL